MLPEGKCRYIDGQIYPDGNFYVLDTQHIKHNGNELKSALNGISADISNKVDKVEGKGLSTEDYTTAEKTKLSGIETNANNYVHPTTSGNKHIPSGGSSGKILGWSANGTAQWIDNPSIEYSDATESTHGLMSAADKTKLNGIESGATNVIVDSTLSASSTNAVQNKAVYNALSDKVDKVSGKGLSTNDYTTTEKNKLSGIEANANNYVHPTTSGNKHIPSGGSSGKILGWSANGTAAWVDPTGGGSVNSVAVGSTTYNPDSNGKVSLPAYPTIKLKTEELYFGLGSQTWTRSAAGMYYTGTKEATTLSEVYSASIDGWTGIKATDVITPCINGLNSNKVYLMANVNSFTSGAWIKVKVVGI